MPEAIITYDLRQGSKDSQQYYKTIEKLAMITKKRIKANFGEIIDAYGDAIEHHMIEKRRTDEEYGLELLMLGVLWQCYSQPSKIIKPYQKKLLKAVVHRRNNTHLCKHIYSHLKGRLIKKYFLNDKEKKNSVVSIINWESLEQLLLYLKATGEFEEESERLSFWKSFLKKRADWRLILKKAISEATYFYQLAHPVLQGYLPQLANFLKDEVADHKGKEDYLLVNRQELEYYLNMVGAEILNQAFRANFIKTTERFVFVPACMAIKEKGNCMRQKEGKGYSCKGCTACCPIHLTMQVAKQYHAETVIVEHGSELYKTKVTAKQGSKGVVGIACPLNLLSGGWKAVKLGYVPQCVLLDWCGCKQHWHKKGIVTDINRSRLKTLLSE